MDKTTHRKLKSKSTMCNYVKSLKGIKRMDCGEWFKEKSFGVQGLECKLWHWTNPYLIPRLPLTNHITGWGFNVLISKWK